MNYVYPIREQEQINAMKTALRRQSERNYMIYLLTINYGRRISDVLKMKAGDIRGCKHLTLKESKTGKIIRIRINPEVLAELKAYSANMADDEYLFPSKKVSKDIPKDSKGHTPIDRIGVWRELNCAAEECGISGGIGTHSLRKTFGYHLYKQTGDIALVQKVFGHRTQLDTLRYIGLEQDYIDSATTALRL